MKKIEKTYTLNAESIDTITADIRKYLTASKNEDTIINKMCLITDEFLDIILEGLGENVPLVLTLSKKAGNLWVRMEYKGKRFNPLDKEQMDSISDSIQSGLEIKPVWVYLIGTNRITLVVPSAGDRSEWIMSAAFLLSLVAGLSGGLIPEEVRSFINSYILMPVSDVFIKLLSVIAPLLIFLSIIISIVQSGTSTSEKFRKYITGRYFNVSIILTIASTIFLYPFFSFCYGEGHGNLAASADQLFRMILDIVPGNPIKPFADGNMLQIIILAALIGVIILSLDNRVKVVNSAITELYTISLHTVEYVCQLLPLFIFSSMTSLLWTNGRDIFNKLWKPIAALTTVYLLLIMIYVLFVAVKYKVSVSILIKKILPSAFSVPIGNQLFCGAGSAVFLSIVYYLAEIFQTPVNTDWFVIAAIISMIVSLASPPVSGGTLICLNILMTSLSIPEGGLAVASTLALLFDFISTGSYIAMRHMEMVLQAGHLETLDVDVLRSEI